MPVSDAEKKADRKSNNTSVKLSISSDISFTRYFPYRCVPKYEIKINIKPSVVPTMAFRERQPNL